MTLRTTHHQGQLYEQADEFAKALAASEAAQSTQMLAAWSDSYWGVRQEIDAFLEKVATAKAAGVTPSPAWAVQQQRLKAVLNETKVQVARYAATAAQVTTGAQKAAVAAGVKHAQKMAATAVAEQVGAAATLNAVNPAVLEAGVGFLADGSVLSQHLAVTLPGPAAERVRGALIHGLATGKGQDWMVRQATEALGVTHTRAVTILRTESLRAYRHASRATYLANQHALGSWTWHAALDGRCCIACVLMDGTEHPLDATLDGHPRCRCAMVPRTKTWDDILGKPTGLPDTRPPVRSGKEWLLGQPAHVQRGLMGPAKFDAWTSGVIDLDDMVGRTYSPQWGTMRAERSLKAILEGENANWMDATSLGKPGQAIPTPKPVIDPAKIKWDTVSPVQVNKLVASVKSGQKSTDDLYAAFQKSKNSGPKANYAKAIMELEGKNLDDLPTPKAPSVPKAGSSWPTKPPWDPGDLTPTGKVLGTSGARVYKAPDGTEWLFKPPKNPADGFLATLDEAASRLQARAGLKAPDTFLVTLGGKRGSIQRMFPASDGFPGGFKPAALSRPDLDAVQREHALDWLLSNHDGHRDQFLRLQDGTLVGIDKGQGFRWFGQDRLDWDFHPNVTYGTPEPVYNALWREFARGGDVDLDPPGQGALWAQIRSIQAIPDDELRDLFRPYAEQAAGRGLLARRQNFPGLKPPSIPANDVEAFLDALVKRKNALGDDFTDLYERAAAAKAIVGKPKPGGPFPFAAYQAPPTFSLPTEGGGRWVLLEAHGQPLGVLWVNDAGDGIGFRPTSDGGIVRTPEFYMAFSKAKAAGATPTEVFDRYAEMATLGLSAGPVQVGDLATLPR